jgi:hypothetical protein
MREWEQGCLNATSVRALEKFAVEMGPRLVGRLNDEQEAILRDQYNAVELALRKGQENVERAEASRAYANAKTVEEPRVAPDSQPMPESPTADDRDAGEAELERYGLVADIMPEDEEVVAQWKKIIDPMIDAATAQDVMDIYAKAEATGEIGKLPELVAFHLRTARFRIKSSKGK